MLNLLKSFPKILQKKKKQIGIYTLTDEILALTNFWWTPLDGKDKGGVIFRFDPH